MEPARIRQIIEHKLAESPGRRGEIIVEQYVREDLAIGVDVPLSIKIPGRRRQVVTMRHQGGGYYTGSYHA